MSLLDVLKLGRAAPAIAEEAVIAGRVVRGSRASRLLGGTAKVGGVGAAGAGAYMLDMYRSVDAAMARAFRAGNTYNGLGGGAVGGGSGAGGGGTLPGAEIPTLKDAKTPTRVSNPTLTTINDSIVRLTSIAVAIANNLQSQQDLLIRQNEAALDASREQAYESMSAGAISPGMAAANDNAFAANDNEDVVAAIEDLQNTVEDANSSSTLSTVIGGALTATGLTSLVKGFFRTKAAETAAATRAAAAAGAESQVARTGARLGGYRALGRGLGWLGVGLAAGDTIASAREGNVGSTLLNAAITAGSIASLGIAGAATSSLALGLGTVAAPILEADRIKNEAFARAASFERDTGIRPVIDSSNNNTVGFVINGSYYSERDVPPAVTNLYNVYTLPNDRSVSGNAAQAYVGDYSTTLNRMIEDVTSGEYTPRFGQAQKPEGTVFASDLVDPSDLPPTPEVVTRAGINVNQPSRADTSPITSEPLSGRAYAEFLGATPGGTTSAIQPTNNPVGMPVVPNLETPVTGQALTNAGTESEMAVAAANQTALAQRFNMPNIGAGQIGSIVSTSGGKYTTSGVPSPVFANMGAYASQLFFTPSVSAQS